MEEILRNEMPFHRFKIIRKGSTLSPEIRPEIKKGWGETLIERATVLRQGKRQPGQRKIEEKANQLADFLSWFSRYGELDENLSVKGNKRASESLRCIMKSLESGLMHDIGEVKERLEELSPTFFAIYWTFMVGEVAGKRGFFESMEGAFRELGEIIKRAEDKEISLDLIYSLPVHKGPFNTRLKEELNVHILHREEDMDAIEFILTPYNTKEEVIVICRDKLVARELILLPSVVGQATLF